MHNSYPYFSTDFDSYGYENEEHVPEKSLLAAILGRALQDLSDRKQRKQALHWFLTQPHPEDIGISYQLCISVLKLGKLHMEFIRQRIEDTLAGRNEMTRLQRLRRVCR